MCVCVRARVCVGELWCCGFCTFMLFLIERGQMDAAFLYANADKNHTQTQNNPNVFMKFAVLYFGVFILFVYFIVM